MKCANKVVVDEKQLQGMQQDELQCMLREKGFDLNRNIYQDKLGAGKCSLWQSDEFG